MTTTVPEAAPERKEKCIICDSEITARNGICSACGFARAAQQCVNCHKRIPAGARMCPICKAYKRSWRFLPELASTVPIIAIIALVSGIYTAYTYLSDRNSHTVLKVTGADANMIYVKVWNTGRKPSTLLGYRLKFDEVAATKEVTLQPPIQDVTAQANNVIVPNEAPVTIKLGLPRLSDLPDSQRTKQYSKEFRIIPMTLEIDVEESDNEGATRQRKDHFKADRIEQLMTRLLQ